MRISLSLRAILLFLCGLRLYRRKKSYLRFEKENVRRIRGGMSFFRKSMGRITDRGAFFNVSVNPHDGIGFGLENGKVMHIREGAPEEVSIGCIVTHVNGTDVSEKSTFDIMKMMSPALHTRENISLGMRRPIEPLGHDLIKSHHSSNTKRLPTPVEDYDRRWGNLNSDDDDDFPSGLPQAAKDNNKKILKRKLDQGASLFEKDGTGWTAFHVASFYGKGEIMNILLQYATRLTEPLNVIDLPLRDGGPSALYLACQQGHPHIVTALLAQNASIEFQTAGGSTPLFIATQSGHINCVKLLLTRGANPNHICGEMGTAACVAASHPDRELLELLVQHGANFSIKSTKANLNTVEILDKFYNLTIRDIFNNWEDRLLVEYHMRTDTTPTSSFITNSTMEIGYNDSSLNIGKQLGHTKTSSISASTGETTNSDDSLEYKMRKSEQLGSIDFSSWDSKDESEPTQKVNEMKAGTMPSCSDDDDCCVARVAGPNLEERYEHYLSDPRGTPPAEVGGLEDDYIMNAAFK